MVLECAGVAQSDATLLHLRFDEQFERLKWWAFLENNWEKVWYWMKNEDFGSNIFQQGTVNELERNPSRHDKKSEEKNIPRKYRHTSSCLSEKPITIKFENLWVTVPWLPSMWKEQDKECSSLHRLERRKVMISILA